MSLANAPGYLVELLSSLVDGTDLVNLLRCGNTRLNHTLQSSQLDLQFHVNHVGFLDIPTVLISLAHDFPRAASLVFLGWSHTGVPSSINTETRFNVSQLKTTRIGVSKFGFIGTGAFVEATTNCLKDLGESLDDVFPDVREWTAGDHLSRFHHPSLRPIHSEQSFYDTHDLVDKVPKSILRLTMSTTRYDPMRESALYTLIGGPDARYLQQLDCATSLLPPDALQTCSFESLSVLRVIYCGVLSMKDLPRGLVVFETYPHGIVFNRNDLTDCQPVFLSSPPPELRELILGGKNELVLEEALPSGLVELKGYHVRDPSFLMNASSLPGSLRLLSLALVRSTENEPALSLAAHLFRDVSSNRSWSANWPAELRIDFPRGSSSHDILVWLEHLPAARTASCNYTLEQWTVSDNPTKSQVEYVLNLPRGVLLEDDGVMHILNAALSGNNLASYGTNFSARKVIVSCCDDMTDEKRLVLENIQKLCGGLSWLHCHNFTGELPVIPAWVKSLSLDYYPIDPLDALQADKIQSVIVSAYPFTSDAIPPGARDSFANESLPPFLYHLPSRLTTLDLYVCNEVIPVFAKSMPRLLPCLPATLQYFRLWSASSGVRVESPALDQVATSLPPNMRLLDWSCFTADEDDAYLFCRCVANIPSLDRLMVKLNVWPNSWKVKMPVVATYHCHAYARDHVNLSALLNKRCIPSVSTISWTIGVFWVFIAWMVYSLSR